MNLDQVRTQVLGLYDRARADGLALAVWAEPDAHEVKWVIGDEQAYRPEYSDFFVLHDFEGRSIRYIVGEWGSIHFHTRGHTRRVKLPFGLSTRKSRELRYERMVAHAIERIKVGEIRKVVLAHTLNTRPRHDLPILPHAFCNMITGAFHSAFRSFIVSPTHGYWWGASPEKLLSTDDNGEFSTMSLAGTRAMTVEGRPSPAWTDKELREQDLVTSFLSQELAATTERLERKRTQNYFTGALWHRRTLFNGRLSADVDALALAERLHPTPAVGGLPVKKALDVVYELEKMRRGLYSGFIGPVYTDGRAMLFVNLRCGHLEYKTCRLWAGAGIVAESDPKAELLETYNKAGSLARVAFAIQ